MCVRCPRSGGLLLSLARCDSDRSLAASHQDSRMKEMEWNDIKLAQIIHFVCFVGLGKVPDF